MASRKELEMTAADRRRDEQARREKAQRHRGKVVAGSGRPLPSRSVPQMVSVRLNPELLSELRTIAEQRGMTLSEVLREAAGSAAAEYRSVPVAWEISVVEVGTGTPHPVGWSRNPPSRSGIREVRHAGAAE